MKTIYTIQQIKRLEQITIDDLGIPAVVLMERAALSVASYVFADDRIPVNRKGKIAVVCGTGNNGGDGIAIARLLFMKQYDVTIILVGDTSKQTELTKQQLMTAEKIGVPILNKLPDISYEIIIDAIFGIGLCRTLDSEFQTLIEQINHSGAKIIAVDIPSGINADTGICMGAAIKADITVTFGAYKPGLLLYPGADHTGTIYIADIGLLDSKDYFLNHMQIEQDVLGSDKKLFCYQSSDLTLLPKRVADSNKGSYGKVLIIAGFESMTGAAILSAKAAYRMGSGLVRVITGNEGAVALQKALPEALVTSYEQAEKQADINQTDTNQIDTKHIDTNQVDTEHSKIKKDIQKYWNWADAVVIGPGLGKSGSAKEAVDTILTLSGKPIIFDADALNLLSEKLDLICKGKTLKERMDYLNQILPEESILTPHLMEFSRLTGLSIEKIRESRIDIIRLSIYNKLVYIVKDARTITAQGELLCFNITGNNGMATAGSGDVLAGIIGSLAASELDTFNAASLGVYLHSLAGDEAAIDKGCYSLMASDIIEALPKVLTAWRESWN